MNLAVCLGCVLKRQKWKRRHGQGNIKVFVSDIRYSWWSPTASFCHPSMSWPRVCCRRSPRGSFRWTMLPGSSSLCRTACPPIVIYTTLFVHTQLRQLGQHFQYCTVYVWKNTHVSLSYRLPHIVLVVNTDEGTACPPLLRITSSVWTTFTVF